MFHGRVADQHKIPSPTKEAAEAERVVSRAGQAAKELAKQQAQHEASMEAMSAAKGKGKGKKENEGKTNKQPTAEKFFDKQRTQTANKQRISSVSANQGWSANQSW